MQGLIGLLMLGAFAVAAAVGVTLGSPANRRKVAAWLIASARAQEDLRAAREAIAAVERANRERVLLSIEREATQSQFRATAAEIAGTTV